MEKSRFTMRDIIYVTILNSNNPFDFVGKIGKSKFLDINFPNPAQCKIEKILCKLRTNHII